MKKILVIEDDTALSNGIVLALKEEGLSFYQSCGIAGARECMAGESFDLAIVDVNLPDGNGLQFLKELRLSSSMPVILLTANDLETDIVTGFELGADDYITKPFSLMVLRARVHAQLRKGRQTPERLEFGRFSFSFDRMEYTVDGQMVELSKTEQKLLKILVENRGITVPRARLVDYIWSDEAEYVDENALSVTVKRLRDKLEETPSDPKYIRMVYGIGYSWVMRT